MTVKILAFDGSGRKGSLNHHLLENVAEQARAAGAEVTVIDLLECDIPFYNGDLEAEEGLPESVLKLKEIFKAHDGFLIASPEYNGTFTPLLKNTIDWVSRPVQGEPPLNCFKGKVAAIMAATPGKMGGLVGLYHLNTLLFRVGTLVVPDLVSIGFAKDAFDDANKLKNDPEKAAATRQAERLVNVAKALKA